MDKKVFDVTSFTKGDKVLVNGIEYEITDINFEDREFVYMTEEGLYVDVNCEGYEYVPAKKVKSSFGSVSVQLYQYRSQIVMLEKAIEENPNQLSEERLEKLRHQVSELSGRIAILEQFEAKLNQHV